MNEEKEFSIEKFLESPRTKFIAEEYKKNLEQEREARELENDPEMAEMVIEDIENILDKADEALYKAKRNGKNRVEVID